MQKMEFDCGLVDWNAFDKIRVLQVLIMKALTCHRDHSSQVPLDAIQGLKSLIDLT